MDIGSIVVQVVDSVPRVVRCEVGDPVGTCLVPATNMADLVDAARANLENIGVTVLRDGLYPCALELQRMAQWPPLPLPDDPITLAEARNILYPGLTPKVGWNKVHRAVQAGRLRAYTVGIDLPRTVVSRADVCALAERATAPRQSA